MTVFDVTALTEVFGNDIVHGAGAVTALTHAFGEEAFLKGHFPGFPVVPGVVLLDGMMLAGLHGVAHATGRSPADIRSVLADAVTFHRPVMPGGKVRFTARIAEQAEGAVALRCAVMVDGARHARAGMTFHFKPTEA